MLPNNRVRKRKTQILLVCSLLATLAVWALLLPRAPSSDEGRFLSLKRSRAAFARVRQVESWLPAGLSSLLHLASHESTYWRRYEDQRQHLLASGYLVEVQVTATDRTPLQTWTAIADVFRATGAFYSAIGPDPTGRIVVTCRPESAHLCTKLATATSSTSGAQPRERAIVTKAKSIVLPEFKSDGATLREALNKLHDASRQNSPDGKGCNFIITNPDVIGTIPKITLALKNITVADAVGHLAKTADVSVSAEDYAFVFAPKSRKP